MNDNDQTSPTIPTRDIELTLTEMDAQMPVTNEAIEKSIEKLNLDLADLTKTVDESLADIEKADQEASKKLDDLILLEAEDLDDGADEDIEI